MSRFCLYRCGGYPASASWGDFSPPVIRRAWLFHFRTATKEIIHRHKLNPTEAAAWHLYDPAFTTVANGKGNAVTSLPAGNGLGYLTLFGHPGQTITVAVH